MTRGCPNPQGAVFALAAALAGAGLAAAGSAMAAPLPASGGDPAAMCESMIEGAQSRYRLPAGMLLAIALVESGRSDPVTHRLRPWPWSVQAAGQSRYFASRAEAVAWVRDAPVSGITSIDVGCMQVNLQYHPQAFASVDAAFDPAGNVDYAARFLLRLHADTGDWRTSIGFYHSRTPALALPYRDAVQQSMRPPLAADTAGGGGPSLADQLARAWRATTGVAAHAAPPGGGRSWDTLLQPPARPQSATFTTAWAARSPERPGG